MKNLSKNFGFTLIELIIGVSIFLSLLTLGWINFSTLPSKVTLNSSYETMYSDIKNQQSEAMNGEGAFGVHFESDHYILFKGEVYNASDTTNFQVNFENANIGITNNLFSGGNIIFQASSGEILNFDAINNSLTLTDNLSGENKVLTLNKYGTEI